VRGQGWRRRSVASLERPVEIRRFEPFGFPQQGPACRRRRFASNHELPHGDHTHPGVVDELSGRLEQVVVRGTLPGHIAIH